VDEKSEWIRVDHPEMPISFELPHHAAVQQVRRFSLAPSLWRDRGRPSVTLFGIRATDEAAARYHAIEIAFLWLTPEFRGVHPKWLRELGSRIKNPKFVSKVVRGALFRAMREVKLEDGGVELVDGHPARRLSVSRRLMKGTAHERVVDGEAYVVPVRPDAVLVAMARFDPAATEEERRDLVKRVVLSVEIGSRWLRRPLTASLAGSPG
jgi:hypothetical protein